VAFAVLVFFGVGIPCVFFFADLPFSLTRPLRPFQFVSGPFFLIASGAVVWQVPPARHAGHVRIPTTYLPVTIFPGAFLPQSFLCGTLSLRSFILWKGFDWCVCPRLFSLVRPVRFCGRCSRFGLFFLFPWALLERPSFFSAVPHVFPEWPPFLLS